MSVQHAAVSTTLAQVMAFLVNKVLTQEPAKGLYIFFPDAVHLLVDMMRCNHHIGAACSRIHHAGLSKTIPRFIVAFFAILHFVATGVRGVFFTLLLSGLLDNCRIFLR